MQTQTMDIGSAAKVLRFKKILVPVDFSPASEKAFTYALRFAQEFRSEWTLLHVLEPATSPTFAGLPEAPVFSEKEFSDAETNFRALMAAANDTGYRREKRSGGQFGPVFRRTKSSRRPRTRTSILSSLQPTASPAGNTFAMEARRNVLRARPHVRILVVREKEHEFI